MGWWKSERGIIGDVPADIMDEALEGIVEAYQSRAGRPPTQGELADLIEFCTCGCLRAACGAPDFPWTQENCREEATPRAAKRGAQGALGEASRHGPGDLANVDPSTGTHYQRSEIRQVIEDDGRERERGLAGEVE